MGQHFKLYNLDNPEEVETSSYGKFVEFFFNDIKTGIHVLRALWNPNKYKKRVVVLSLNKAEGFSFTQESNENLFKGPVNQLSNEVLDIIFGQILDILDLVNLMVTCQRHWELGRHHLERLIEPSIVGSWAGDRLICLGEYARPNDLPHGMLTDSELEHISPFYYEYNSWRESIALIQTPPASTTMKHKPITSTDDFLFELLQNIADRKMASRQYNCKKILDVLQKLILIKDLEHDDFTNGSLVFRNLTTKEYVRGDGLKKAWDIPDKPWLKRLRFKDILLIRTTWSSDPSLSCLYRGPLQIHRGIWAGHRFDVTSIQCVLDEDGVAVDNWKDVTKEVISEMMEVWEPEGLQYFNH